MTDSVSAATREVIRRGTVIPAMPLVLDAARRLDERRQRALVRYYLDAGAGGVAVGMHFTQFEIRRPGIDLYEPVLRLTAEEADAYVARTGRPVAKLAGINGVLSDARRQVATARELGYDYAVISMAALRGCLEQEMLHHIRELARVMPLFAFYLPVAVGGVAMPAAFWREVVEIEAVHGIKIAPFNDYSTLDVVRAVAESGRADAITLYTGNDNSIVRDLITPFRFGAGDGARTIRVRGGLLGQWACWTRRAVELLDRLHAIVDGGEPIDPDLMTLASQITDANGAIFDVAHHYAGGIPGIHEILRRQGLLEGIWTLKRDEVLSPGQAEQIDRVCAAYPHLNDDAFVRENLDRWLAD
ncbi:MAG: dihydrodipicolinate synthase family protein [Planctomycetota bacterium]